MESESFLLTSIEIPREHLKIKGGKINEKNAHTSS